MPTVEAIGWNPGANKVAYIEIFQAATGLELAEVKRGVDGVVADERARRTVPTDVGAQSLVVSRHEAGFVARIVRSVELRITVRQRSLHISSEWKGLLGVRAG